MKSSEFIALSPRHQAEFLLLFVFQMTISTRSVILSNGPESTAQLNGVNEMNHRYISFIYKKLFDENRETYSGRDLIEMLQEIAEQHHLKDEISNAWMGAEHAFAMRQQQAADPRSLEG